MSLLEVSSRFQALRKVQGKSAVKVKCKQLYHKEKTSLCNELENLVADLTALLEPVSGSCDRKAQAQYEKMLNRVEMILTIKTKSSQTFYGGGDLDAGLLVLVSGQGESLRVLQQQLYAGGRWTVMSRCRAKLKKRMALLAGRAVTSFAKELSRLALALKS